MKAMIGVTLATAITPTAITMAFRARQWALALGFLIMLPAAILIVFAAAVSRTGASADMQHQAAQMAARNANLDTTVEQEAYKALHQAKQDAKTECNDGRGKNCKAFEATRDAAQKRWDDAVKAIKGETVSIADPWFSRAAALSKGLVTEDDMRTYWPALPPIIVSVFAGLLIAFGTHFKSPRPHASQPAPQIAPALTPRRGWRPEMPRIAWRGKSRGLAPQIASNAVPGVSGTEDEEVDDNQIEILEPERKPSLLRRKAPELKLVATNNNFAIMGICGVSGEVEDEAVVDVVDERRLRKSVRTNCCKRHDILMRQQIDNFRLKLLVHPAALRDSSTGGLNALYLPGMRAKSHAHRV